MIPEGYYLDYLEALADAVKYALMAYKYDGVSDDILLDDFDDARVDIERFVENDGT